MKYLIFIFLLTSFCHHKIPSTISQQIEHKSPSYPPTILPSDTSKLWVAAGNPEQEVVLILLQGGPKDYLGFVDKGKTSWRYLPNYEQYYRVHLHQANTYNPKIFEYNDSFTLKMAKTEVDNTSEMLYQTIKYFKDRQKTVYVLGHSYGAFIIPHYLSTRPSLADKYVVISGRIDDDPVGLEAHRQGFNGIYVEDGRKFESDKEQDLTDYTESEKKYYQVKQWLKWAIGLPKYSEKLSDIDLSNMTYIYCPNDSRVGRLTEEEIDFLTSKKANVFSTNHKHGHTIRALVDLVAEGKIEL
ncbi:MAG: hypothetical protein AB8B69_22840 [Chitinophagales bacterium]